MDAKGYQIQFITVSQFNDHAQVHHRNPFADMTHHGKIMGNEQIGQIELVPANLQAD